MPREEGWMSLPVTDADKEGYLVKPNVDLVVEITNMLMARRVFEANLAAMKSTKQMAIKALEIGR
jgi:flagellar basal-body rod protein FlgC